MASFLGLDHPWFRPKWRRVLVVALCLGWAAVEFLTASGSPFWGMLFGALGLYAAYALFVTYPKDPPP